MTLLRLGTALLVAWPLYSVILIWLAMRSERSNSGLRRLDAMTPNHHEPHRFWVVIPCLNEERVVERTVRSALALAGPPGSSTYVLVVDDGSDDATPQILASIAHPNLVVLRRELPNARRGKGEALNDAYDFIVKCSEMYEQDPRQIAIGIIDGDGRGSYNLLTEVARAMRDPRVGAVQARVRIHNRNRILGAVQDLEFGCVANASQVLRNGVGTVGLGGNGQFTRLSALIELGGAPWSSCLVEDLELGIRMHLSGARIRYVSLASVTQQGVVDAGRLLRQRTRWAQGNLQCVRYLPRLIASRKIGNIALIEMMYYLLAPWLNAVGAVVIVGAWSLAAWGLLPGHRVPVPVLGDHFLVASWRELLQLTGIGLVAMVVPHLLWSIVHRWQLRDERLSRMFLAGLVYPVFLLLGLVGTLRAMARQLTGRNTWAKTERLAESPVV